eukprot:tig00000042_g15459.t1
MARGLGWIPGSRKLDLQRLGRTKWPAAEIEEAGPENILELDLSYNVLTSIPGDELAKLTNLATLRLRGNRLTALPPEIGRLGALQHLCLDSNQLTALPPEIGHLAALEQLRVRINQLTALPSEIGRLAALEVLDVSLNQLTALPPEVGRLAVLQQLWVNDNPAVESWPEPVRCAVNKDTRNRNGGREQCAAIVPYLRSLAAAAPAPAAASRPAPAPPALAGPAPPFQLEEAEAEQLGAAAQQLGATVQQLGAVAERLRVLASERAAAVAEAAALRERLALYEGESAAAPGGRPWNEAELEAAAERLKAATRRVEALRIEARAAARIRFQCTICLEEKERGERRALNPCGHVVCAACAQQLADGARRACPKCRRPFQGFIPIFE